MTVLDEVEIDGVIYEVRVMPHPDELKAMIGLKILELEIIGMAEDAVERATAVSNPVGSVEV